MKATGDWPVFDWNSIPAELSHDDFIKAAQWWQRRDESHRLELELSSFSGLDKCESLFRVATLYFRTLMENEKFLFAVTFRASVIQAMEETRTLVWMLEQTRPKEVQKQENIRLREAGLEKYRDAALKLREAAQLVGLPKDFYLRVPTTTAPQGQPPKFLCPEDTIFVYRESPEQLTSRQKMINAIVINDGAEDIVVDTAKRGRHSNNAYLIRKLCEKLRRCGLEFNSLEIEFNSLESSHDAIADLLQHVGVEVSRTAVRDALRNR